MKFVSLGIVLIVLLLPMYILLSISETRQKPIHLQCRTKMEKPFCWNTPMFRVICRRKRKFYTRNYSIWSHICGWNSVMNLGETCKPYAYVYVTYGYPGYHLFPNPWIRFLRTQCTHIYVFHVIPITNSCYLTRQRYRVGLCNGDELCSLWGKNRIFFI